MSSWPWMKRIDEAITSNPIDPVNDRDRRPLVIDLIKEHRDKIDKVRAAVESDPLYDPSKHDDLWIMRFVMSHKKTKPAVKAIHSTLQFRKKYNLDDKDVRPLPPQRNREPPHYHFYDKYHGDDAMITTIPDLRRGVIDFLRIASIDERAMVADGISQELWVMTFIYNAEWTYQWLDYVTRTTGRFTKSIRCISLDGLGYSTFTATGIQRDGASMKITEDAYPQSLDRLCLVNPPAVFNALWLVARPLLPKRITSKIGVISPGTNPKHRDMMYDYISQDHLPTSYGGTNGQVTDWTSEMWGQEQHQVNEK